MTNQLTRILAKLRDDGIAACDLPVLEGERRMTDARIYIDMDGVLSEFWGHALDTLGLSEWRDKWPPGRYDMENVIGWETKQFWKVLDRHDMWACMPKTPWADDLMGECRATGIPVAILSSPARGNCASWKYEWADKHYPGVPLITCRRKEVFPVSSKTLLIDDRDRNIERWTDAGGAGVLVPRVFNSEHDLPTYTTVIQRLNTWVDTLKEIGK